jgi:hypothetical protein
LKLWPPNFGTFHCRITQPLHFLKEQQSLTCEFGTIHCKITQPLNFAMKLETLTSQFRNISLQNHAASQLCHETWNFDLPISEHFTAKSRNFSTLPWNLKLWPPNFGTFHCRITQPLKNNARNGFSDQKNHTMDTHIQKMIWKMKKVGLSLNIYPTVAPRRG